MSGTVKAGVAFWARGLALVSTATLREAEQTSSTQATRMQPVSFNNCFGWLHEAAYTGGAATAVVLCQGLKTDGLSGYRSFRQLADALAEAGYPTLRFDYPGTGDSCDIDQAEYLATWQRSVDKAADWIRDHVGATRIVLCGLRFGALLAAITAAARADVVGLVMLAPVLRGRTYMRQLITEMNVRRPADASESGFVAHELQLSEQTVRAINGIDLRNLAIPHRCRTAIFAQSRSRALSDCVDAWQSSGGDVTCDDFTGLEPMLRPNFMIHEAPADVRHIVAWLGATIPPDRGGDHHRRIPQAADLRPPHCIETAVRFGPGENLYGMLCRPLKPERESLAVVIVNSSGDPHQGSARLGVDLARRFAAAGIASLRMDFAGLGDSVTPGDAETHVFETDRRADIAAAVDALTKLGYRQFAVQGLCSGAYHAYHAALADTRIGWLLLVNLPMFQWRKGDAIEFMSHALNSPVQLLPRLRNKELWRRVLLQGWAGLRRRFAMQAGWFADRFKAAGQRHAHLFGLPVRPTAALDSLHRLSERARMLFLFAEGDPGVLSMTLALGSKRLPAGTHMHVLPDLTHGVTEADMKCKVAEYMIAFLKEDPGPAPAPTSRTVRSLFSPLGTLLRRTMVRASS